MSAYLNIDAITTNISRMGIPGVNVLDVADMPEAVYSRDCPLLAPAPSYLSNVAIERVSFGSATEARKTITYSLTYRLFYAELGSGRGLLDIYNDLLTCLDTVISEFVDNDSLSGTIDITPTGATAPGVVTDPAGKQFFGSDITLDVTVFVR